MKQVKKLESLNQEMFKNGICNKLDVVGGFCCTIIGGRNTLNNDGTVTWDCPKESFTSIKTNNSL
jgi:hypothetical protein